MSIYEVIEVHCHRSCGLTFSSISYFSLYSDSSLSYILYYINHHSMKQQFLDWEAKYWFTPYVYGFVLYLLLTAMLINAKIVATSLDIFYTLSVRVTPIICINGLVLISESLEMNQKDPQIWRLLLKRSIIHAVGQTFMFISAYFNSISITSTFYNLGPVMAFFLESYMYEKPISKGHLALTMVCFIGVMLIIQPSFLFGHMNEDVSIFWLMPLIAAFMNSLSSIYLHNLKGKVNSKVPLQYFITFQGIIAGLGQNIFPHEQKSQPFQLYHFANIVMMVIFSYSSQLLLYRALYLKKPSYILPLGYASVIFSVVMDAFLFGQTFTFIGIVGIVLTSSGLLMKLLLDD